MGGQESGRKSSPSEPKSTRSDRTPRKDIQSCLNYENLHTPTKNKGTSSTISPTSIAALTFTPNQVHKEVTPTDSTGEDVTMDDLRKAPVMKSVNKEAPQDQEKKPQRILQGSNIEKK